MNYNPKPRRGLLVVVSAGSGAGKSTLCRQLVARRKNLTFSVSATTRLPRPGEREGSDYYFVTPAAFEAMRRRKELVEWANVHGQHYGTPKAALERTLRKGQDLLLDIDVQGALQVKRRYPEAVLIFITTPTFADLEKRLRARRSESETQIQKRLANARHELRFLKHYDYCVVNDRISNALKRLHKVLDAEHMRITRRAHHD